MPEKNELMRSGKRYRGGEDQPEIIEPEIVEPGDRALKLPFPLTAEKLEAIVRRNDAAGPIQLGVFYTAILRKECALLLPRPVWGFDDPALTVLLDTWNSNFMFFKCRAIGDVLVRYETMRW